MDQREHLKKCIFDNINNVRSSIDSINLDNLNNKELLQVGYLIDRIDSLLGMYNQDKQLPNTITWMSTKHFDETSENI